MCPDLSCLLPQDGGTSLLDTWASINASSSVGDPLSPCSPGFLGHIREKLEPVHRPLQGPQYDCGLHGDHLKYSWVSRPHSLAVWGWIPDPEEALLSKDGCEIVVGRGVR